MNDLKRRRIANEFFQRHRFSDTGGSIMDLDELYQRERYADFVREADHDRQVRAANQALGRKPFYKPLLSTVGATLVEVGNRLQDNVETVTPARNNEFIRSRA